MSQSGWDSPHQTFAKLGKASLLLILSAAAAGWEVTNSRVASVIRARSKTLDCNDIWNFGLAWQQECSTFVLMDRVVISGRALAVVIAGWLRRVPKWAWGKEPNYEKLKAEKRHGPFDEPNPRMIAAELIAAEMERLGWEVSYKRPAGTYGSTARPVAPKAD